MRPKRSGRKVRARQRQAVGPTLNRYQQQVRRHLAYLERVLGRTAVDDFQTKVRLPAKDDEFTPLYIGIQILLESVKEKVFEFDQVSAILAGNLKELELTNLAIGREKATDEAILQNIGEGLIVIDAKKIVLLMNPPAERILGWPSREMLGKSWNQIIEVTDTKGQAVNRNDRPIQKALRTGKKVVGHNYYYRRQDGSQTPVTLTATPVILGDKTIGAVGIFRDITEEVDLDQAKTEVISFTSHQLRTPLSVLNWYTEKLLSQDFGPFNAKQIDYLEAMDATIKKTISLVNTFLNVSRLQLGTLPVSKSRVDLAQIIDDVLREYHLNIRNSYLRVDKIIDAAYAVAWADPKLVRVVLQNLIGNAVKYTPHHGQLTIKVAPELARNGNGQQVIIKIADTGYGIPKSQQSRIFSRLFRADNVKEIDTEGAGLGLYMVRLLVSSMGGEVWFESVVNKGTIFYVALPTRLTKLKKHLKQTTTKKKQ